MFIDNKNNFISKEYNCKIYIDWTFFVNYIYVVKENIIYI